MRSPVLSKRTLGPALLFWVSLVFVILFTSCETREDNHIVLGRWKGGFQTISFYKGGLASLNGVKSTWKTVNQSTVLLEVVEGDTAMLLEFEVRWKDGVEIGIMGLGGFETEFTRER